MVRRTCRECAHFHAGEDRRHPAMGFCDLGYRSCRARSSAACRCGFEPWEQPAPTRADRVRAMTDEQLADAILDIPGLDTELDFCRKVDCEEAEKGECWSNGACRACLIGWLREAAE